MCPNALSLEFVTFQQTLRKFLTVLLCCHNTLGVEGDWKIQVIKYCNNKDININEMYIF